MGWPAEGQRLDLLLEGFDRLKLGSLLVVAGYVVTVLSLVVFFASMMFAPWAVRRGPGGPEAPLIAAGVGVMAVVLVGVALALMGFIVLLLSTGSFRDYDPGRLGRGSTAARLVVAGLTLVVLGVLAAMASPRAVGVGIVLAALGTLTAFAGNILFALFIKDLARLRDYGLEVPRGFETAGTLLLVGIILSVVPVLSVIGGLLSITGLALVYKHSKDALEALRLQARRSPPPGPQPWKPPGQV